MADPISWTDMKQRADTHGLLGKELFVVFTTPVAPFDAILDVLAEHIEFQKDLEARGIMFAAGPLADLHDPAQWVGEGMVVIRAPSLEAAQEIAASDPMHKTGVRSFVVRKWMVNEGTFTVKVGFSTGNFDLD